MSRRGLAALGALAVLAALAFVLQPLLAPSPSGSSRGSGAGPTVRCLAPQGDIPRSPTRFVWTSDPVATAYRFQLMGHRDLVLYDRVTPDTALDLPSGIVDWNIMAGATWRVTPVTGATEGVPSDLAVFGIVSP